MAQPDRRLLAYDTVIFALGAKAPKVKAAVQLHLGLRGSAGPMNARKHGADGVICVHITTPPNEMRGAIRYINTGRLVGKAAPPSSNMSDGRMEINRLVTPHLGKSRQVAKERTPQQILNGHAAGFKHTARESSASRTAFRSLRGRDRSSC